MWDRSSIKDTEAALWAMDTDEAGINGNVRMYSQLFWHDEKLMFRLIILLILNYTREEIHPQLTMVNTMRIMFKNYVCLYSDDPVLKVFV